MKCTEDLVKGENVNRRREESHVLWAFTSKKKVTVFRVDFKVPGCLVFVRWCVFLLLECWENENLRCFFFIGV